MFVRKLLGLGLAAVTLAAVAVRAEVQIPETHKTAGFFVGCQAWTWNRFSAMEAVERTALAGGKVIEFYPGQRLSKEQPDLKWDHNASSQTIQQMKAQLDRFGIKAVNYGVVNVPRDPAEARKIFQFAKTMGMRAITTESVDALDTMEPLVKEFDVMVALHNHPRRPNDPNYKVWDPNYILSVVKDRDRRIGACADTGHWVRSGIKPVDALRILRGRIISSHLKDLHEFTPRGHDVPYGTGVSDVPAILEELRRQKFTGNISVEYEHNMEASMPEVAQCVGFLRGYGRGRKWD